MKKIISMFAFVAVLGMALVAAQAADAPAETTVKGTMKCAKCSLKEADACQAVLVVKDGDKEIKYYIVGPKAGAEHKEICKADKENVTLTGVVTEKDGKKEIKVTKAE